MWIIWYRHRGRVLKSPTQQLKHTTDRYVRFLHPTQPHRLHSLNWSECMIIPILKDLEATCRYIAVATRKAAPLRLVLRSTHGTWHEYTHTRSVAYRRREPASSPITGPAGEYVVCALLLWRAPSARLREPCQEGHAVNPSKML